MSKLSAYPFEIRALSEEDGGGFLISYPDFAECIADGETVEKALAQGCEALKATIAALKANKLPVPTPNRGGVASGKFVPRVPTTMTLKNIPEEVYARLKQSAAEHRRSLNSEAIVCLETVLVPSRIDPSERLARARALRAALPKRAIALTAVCP